jgi:hypothetical protein
MSYVYCRNYAAANAQADELVALAAEKGALFWKAFAMMSHASVLALTGKASNTIQMLTSAIAAWRTREQHCGRRCFFHIWPWRMQSLGNLTTLGVALAKR